MNSLVGTTVVSSAIAMAWLGVAPAAAAQPKKHKRTVLLFMEGGQCEHTTHLPDKGFELSRSNKDEGKWHIHNECETAHKVVVCPYVGGNLAPAVFEKCSLNTVFEVGREQKKKLTCKGKKYGTDQDMIKVPVTVAMYVDPADGKCPDTPVEHSEGHSQGLSEAVSTRRLLYHSIDIEIVP